MSKPVLCLDFDGVLHSYTSGWQGAAIIPDPPVPGALEFLRRALEHFEVHIFSSRSHQEGGIKAMRRWLLEHVSTMGPLGHDYCRWLGKIKFPTEKPPAMITIDDRALTFRGDWSEFDPEKLLDFKPWNYTERHKIPPEA